MYSVDNIEVFSNPSVDAKESTLVLSKETLTIEDVVFMHARAAVSSIVNNTTKIDINFDMRKQITRVPNG